jgi:demethylmenaquinone methyltransferase/2-methoxy-6-polyprenyl-1,4-benzoquinol methylase
VTGRVGLKPHPTLRRFYLADEERPKLVRDLFDGGARHYDWICRAMSLGSGQMYRRMALERAGLRPGMRVLDVATGTGLVAIEAVRVLGRSQGVVGLDVSSGMLEECRRALDIPLLRASGEALPIGDQCFDLLSMGYALRHVSDLEAAFREYSRVLKPGGRVLLLEITRPASWLGYRLARLYLKRLVPLVTLIGTRSRGAARLMEYYWDTIEGCVPPAAILEALRGAGFVDVERRSRGGLLSEYLARRPPAAAVEPAPS